MRDTSAHAGFVGCVTAPATGLAFHALASVASTMHVQQPPSTLPSWAVDSCFQDLDRRRRKRRGSLSPPNSPGSPQNGNQGNPKKRKAASNPVQVFPLEHQILLQEQPPRNLGTEEVPKSSTPSPLAGEVDRLRDQLSRLASALEEQAKQHADELDLLRRELEIKDYMITGMKQHVERLEKQLAEVALKPGHKRYRDDDDSNELLPAPKRHKAV